VRRIEALLDVDGNIGDRLIGQVFQERAPVHQNKSAIA
jgi:hypothetical protein